MAACNSPSHLLLSRRLHTQRAGGTGALLWLSPRWWQPAGSPSSWSWPDVVSSPRLTAETCWRHLILLHHSCRSSLLEGAPSPLPLSGWDQTPKGAGTGLTGLTGVWWIHVPSPLGAFSSPGASPALPPWLCPQEEPGTSSLV